MELEIEIKKIFGKQTCKSLLNANRYLKDIIIEHEDYQNSHVRYLDDYFAALTVNTPSYMMYDMYEELTIANSKYKEIEPQEFLQNKYEIFDKSYEINLVHRFKEQDEKQIGNSYIGLFINRLKNPSIIELTGKNIDEKLIEQINKKHNFYHRYN